MATDFQTTTVRYDLCISGIDIEDFSNEGRISRQICLKVHNMLLFYTFYVKICAIMALRSLQKFLS